MKRWGTEEWFSPTHARFAADLLTDCRNEFLGISGRLDDDLDGKIRRLLRESDAATGLQLISLRGDRDKFIAAAAYAQWISDHIWQEAARCEREIAAALARSAVTSDPLALLEQRVVPFDGGAPASEPPPFPEPLDDRVYVLRIRSGQVDCVRVRLSSASSVVSESNTAAWLSSASSAVSESNTASMNVLRQHIGLLSDWLDKAALRALSGLSEQSDPDFS